MNSLARESACLWSYRVIAKMLLMHLAQSSPYSLLLTPVQFTDPLHAVRPRAANPIQTLAATIAATARSERHHSR